MAHAPYSALTDLQPIFDRMREWPHVKEPSPGVFYIRTKPFLHFHMSRESRWADVRDGLGWGTPVDLPTDASKTVREAFLVEVERRYQATLAALGGKGTRGNRSAAADTALG